jgi:hypothetical protein
MCVLNLDEFWRTLSGFEIRPHLTAGTALLVKDCNSGYCD